VDGVNVTQIQNGGVGKNYQMEFIDEVEVTTNSFEAEIGGALGGVINVVPMRGSNDWHGALLTYLSSSTSVKRGRKTGPF
jgi:outer membrane receptor for ferrienterochelin and colicin